MSVNRFRSTYTCLLPVVRICVGSDAVRVVHARKKPSAVVAEGFRSGRYRTRICDLHDVNVESVFSRSYTHRDLNPCFTVKTHESVSCERLSECNDYCNRMRLYGVVCRLRQSRGGQRKSPAGFPTGLVVATGIPVTGRCRNSDIGLPTPAPLLRSPRRSHPPLPAPASRSQAP